MLQAGTSWPLPNMGKMQQCFSLSRKIKKKACFSSCKQMANSLLSRELVVLFTVVLSKIILSSLNQRTVIKDWFHSSVLRHM